METDFHKFPVGQIVKYTNEYGVVHAKRWKDISRKDLESFFSVLFISGIQKRKDKPSNWFSENRLLENPLVKEEMSGRKFFSILWYLHCCPVRNKDHSADGYDPSYKIAEVQDYLENWYLNLFLFRDNNFPWMRLWSEQLEELNSK
jgi:Transposase IS4